MAVTHDLKTMPVYFDAVERGEKTFEIRRDDRGFQKGDTVRLLRYEDGEYFTNAETRARGSMWNHEKTRYAYSAIAIERRILWILTGGQFGLEPGFVILALGLVDEAEASAQPITSAQEA